MHSNMLIYVVTVLCIPCVSVVWEVDMIKQAMIVGLGAGTKTETKMRKRERQPKQKILLSRESEGGRGRVEAKLKKRSEPAIYGL